ncbi:hypothetical protein Dimus_035469 [Dionaea muscipula]
MKREMERKEQEKKKNQKVEFVPGGTQSATAIATPKVNIPVPGVSNLLSGGLQSAPAAPEVVSREGRLNKKSKWDKVIVNGCKINLFITNYILVWSC